jgi:hypothetical protein
MDGGGFITTIDGESGILPILNTSERLTNLGVSISGQYLYETGNIFNLFTGVNPVQSGKIYKFFKVIPATSGQISYFSGSNLFSFLPSPNYNVFDPKNLVFYSLITGNNYLNFSGLGPDRELLTGITTVFAGYRELSS